MIPYINLNVELDFLGLDYFFSHGVVISYMPFFFFFSFFLENKHKESKMRMWLDISYFLQFDTCLYENLKHCYNHSRYWMPYSMYMEMRNILVFFSLENKLEII